ncbi:DUF5906 domain-containing protein [Paraburkholderia sp. BR10936]|uniref:DUF5906 domain-containing protein n=1 Tax=Paraburkholderia sp. BR10936 TaxID=3236993 RepID=UPI0034D2C314
MNDFSSNSEIAIDSRVADWIWDNFARRMWLSRYGWKGTHPQYKGKLGWSFGAFNRGVLKAALEACPGEGFACGLGFIKPGENTTYLAAFDLDDHGKDMAWSDMQAVALNLLGIARNRGLYGFTDRSPGGHGVHIWFRFDAPQDAYSVRALLLDVLKECGLANGGGGVRVGQAEIFPKQPAVGEGECGNWLALPCQWKSRPLDDTFDELDDMPVEAVVAIDWPASQPVPMLDRAAQTERAAVPHGEVPVELEKIQAALEALPNGGTDSLEYDHNGERGGYLDVMWAVGAGSHWSDEGRELLRSWTSLSSKYDEAEDDKQWAHGFKKWDAARNNGTLEKLVGVGTLFRMASRCTPGWDRRWTVASPDEFGVVDEPQDPPWHEGWYFLSASDRVVRLGEVSSYTMKGFNVRHAGLVLAAGKGRPPTPFEFVEKRQKFGMADALAYAPGQAPVFKFQGHTFVNSYRPASAPDTPAALSSEQRAAVDLVRRHIRLIAGNDDTARMLETWIALNVRSPGKLIGVALLVKGIQGDGKTTIFSKLMSAVMGAENVGNVSNTTLRRDFTAWASGRAIRVVEEVKAAGHSRHDVLNSVKPYITNETVAIEGKGRDSIDSLNTTNYVALTNFDDALPIDDGDRRWWIVDTPFTHIAQLTESVGGNLASHFDELHAAIEAHGGALRKHFLECELHKSVRYNMRAPETEGRRRMIRAESDLVGGDYLDSYIEQGAYGVSKDAIASSAISDLLREVMGGDAPQTRKLQRLLDSRGYRPCSKPLKWDGKTHRVYVKDARMVDTDTDLARKRVQKLLDATKAAAGGVEFAEIGEMVAAE